MKVSVGALVCCELFLFSIFGLYLVTRTPVDQSTLTGLIGLLVFFIVCGPVLMVRAKRRDVAARTAVQREIQFQYVQQQLQSGIPAGMVAPTPPNISMTTQAALGLMYPGEIAQTPYGAFRVGTKSKKTAGLLGIFLGQFGAGGFYAGQSRGVAQLIVSVVTMGIGWVWGLSEGILVLLAKPGEPLSLDGNGDLMV